jgi:hypothetical protein
VKRRITLVVDDDKRKAEGVPPMFSSTRAHFGPSYGWTGVTVEAVEPIPEPDRVQEFSVRIVTKATEPALTVGQVKWLIQISYRRIKDVTVTEVKS